MESKDIIESISDANDLIMINGLDIFCILTIYDLDVILIAMLGYLKQ